MRKLIDAVEELLKNPDDFKPYEDNYRSGWIDACNRVLEILHTEANSASAPRSENDFD
jgi:hypothetical protein